MVRILLGTRLVCEIYRESPLSGYLRGGHGIGGGGRGTGRMMSEWCQGVCNPVSVADLSTRQHNIWIRIVRYSPMLTPPILDLA